ncbi:hypothetical protein MMC13_002189 [Lambiella insularis]|nr:hypothetical protein [Lambiella insularis]
MSGQGYAVDEDTDFQAFRKEMQLKAEDKRLQTEKQSALRIKQRRSKQKNWRQQIRRAQQYLAISTSHASSAGSMGAICSGLGDLTVTTKVIKEDATDTSLHKEGDIGSLLSDVKSFTRFISVDVEAWEFDQKLITEIGISTLDTVELLGSQPLARGNNWAAKIRSRHFRIRENGHLVNKVHVEGWPENFNFGQSEWISKKNIKQALEDCFHPPLSHLSMYPNRTCKVVLVAHDVEADMKYLAQLGFDVNRMISDCIDTSDIFKAVRRDSRQSALSNLLLEYGIAGKYLHNAGNDANYTLRVMIAIALDASKNKRTLEEWETEKQNRINAACEEARARVCTEFDGWNSSEDEDIGKPLTVPSTIVPRQGRKTPIVAKDGNRLTPKPADPRRRDGSLGEVAVQENSKTLGLPFHTISAEGQLSRNHDRGHDEVWNQRRDQNQNRSQSQQRGRDGGRGRGRGQGRGRGRGEGGYSAEATR